MSSVNPADYLRRFSSHLMLEPQDMRVRNNSQSSQLSQHTEALACARALLVCAAGVHVPELCSEIARARCARGLSGPHHVCGEEPQHH